MKPLPQPTNSALYTAFRMSPMYVGQTEQRGVHPGFSFDTLASSRIPQELEPRLAIRDLPTGIDSLIPGDGYMMPYLVTDPNQQDDDPQNQKNPYKKKKNSMETMLNPYIFPDPKYGMN